MTPELMQALSAVAQAIWSMLYKMPAAAWAALAGWATAVIALVTVIVAGVYARKQVEEMRQSREEQAQPNVVIFVEPNRSSWKRLDLVVKNFGVTPAYNVVMAFDPPLCISPNPNKANSSISLLRYPERIYILAPGQEWRTVWDNAEWRFLCAGIEMTHRASVSYQDSKGENYKNPAILDWNTFAPMTRFPAKTVHDIAVELKNQNKHLDDMRVRLKKVVSPHGGVWLAGVVSDEEEGYEAVREAVRQMTGEGDASSTSTTEGSENVG